jgi:heme/copper-type cytochrome/quinol oxidase subunit 2
LKIQYFTQRSVSLSIVRRLQAALLSATLLLTASCWDGAYAQNDTGETQVQFQTTTPDRPDQVQEGSHELASFFLIGIMINVLALVLFGVWAAREWKKKKPVSRVEDK